MFSRKELIRIRDRAKTESQTSVLKNWQEAYWSLACAADCLDAMMVRAQEKTKKNTMKIKRNSSLP